MSYDNLHEVKLHDGQGHDVQTPHYHDDHEAKTWQAHIVDMPKNVVAGITVQRIESIIFKGRCLAAERSPRES